MELKQLKAQALANPEVKLEYDRLESEFRLIDELLSMRRASGLTQQQVASAMQTQKSNISRLEAGRANPSWSTLTKYALACGFDISIKPKRLKRTTAK